MQATRARFLRLRNMANLRSGRANAYFYKFLCTGTRGRPEKSRRWSLEKPPWICLLKNASVAYILGSSSNQDDDGDKNVANLHIWQWKQQFCTLCTCIFHFLTFCRRTRSFYDVKWLVLQLSGQREHMMTNVVQLCLLISQALVPI